MKGLLCPKRICSLKVRYTINQPPTAANLGIRCCISVERKHITIPNVHMAWRAIMCRSTAYLRSEVSTASLTSAGACVDTSHLLLQTQVLPAFLASTPVWVVEVTDRSPRGMQRRVRCWHQQSMNFTILQPLGL